MKIDALVLGDYQTNCYCLRQKQNSTDCLIIDTGLDAEPLLDFLTENHLNPVALLLTHGHADHIAGINPLRNKFPDIKVAIHADDAKMLSNPVKNLSVAVGKILKTSPADIITSEGAVLEFAGIKLEVIHTPGHTAGGICLYCRQDKVVFVGDTLFAGSVGRTDFPGGNFEKLISGIKQKLLILDNDTTVYPGHGPATTIGAERTQNPFLQQK